jgi:hypothetical protein
MALIFTMVTCGALSYFNIQNELLMTKVFLDFLLKFCLDLWEMEKL